MAPILQHSPQAAVLENTMNRERPDPGRERRPENGGLEPARPRDVEQHDNRGNKSPEEA